MKRIGWIAGAVLIVVVLTASEAMILSKAAGTEKKVMAVFAAVPIRKNAVITSGMLRLREVPVSLVHPDALKTADAAVSKRAAMDIEAGEQLLGGKVTSAKQGIPEARDRNDRLVSLKLEADQANGWQLAVDQYVDVLYVPGSNEPVSGNIQVEGLSASEGVMPGVLRLPHVRVAGLIRENGKLQEDASAGMPKYVSLEVTVSQAGFLAYAKNNGKLELACIPDGAEQSEK